MKEAGLTHGGFYAHFDSREALVIEAFATRWTARPSTGARSRRLRGEAAVDHHRSYVSGASRRPGRGCATLGADRARKPKTRKALPLLEQMIDVMADQFRCAAKTARWQAMGTLATMMVR
jgi:TetR/AcrR family transcriptional repressor of nem operon